MTLAGGAAAGAVLAGTRTAAAQSQNRVYRLGHLTNTELSEKITREITLPELARLGFAEGRNLAFDGRVGEAADLPALMGGLLAARADAIIAVGPAALKVAAANRTVPIITFGADPIQMGFASSYARPGGNVTGVLILNSELEVKRLSILLEAVRGLKRIAILTSEETSLGEAAVRKAGIEMGLDVISFPAATPADYAAAFAAMRAGGAEAVLISASPVFFRDGARLAALAHEARLPSICEWAEMAHTGCLIGYGPNRAALRRRMAQQIAQIFSGVAPGDIAIERPTVFEFAVNQKVARSLQISIPLPVLAQADEVIE